MIRLLTAALLFASFNTVAQTEVPHVFVDGTAASAAEVNENFGALRSDFDENRRREIAQERARRRREQQRREDQRRRDIQSGFIPPTSADDEELG